MAKGFARPPKPHRTGPMRAVRRVLVRMPQLYDQNLVELECGHRVKSNSPVGRRAHCGECKKLESPA